MNVSSKTPVYVQPKRLNPVQREQLRKHLDALVGQGILEEAVSEYGFPVHIATDPTAPDVTRFLPDFRKLVPHLKRDRPPNLAYEKIVQKISGDQYFSKLSLHNLHHHVRIRQQDRPLFTVTSELGNYQFTRLPQHSFLECTDVHHLLQGVLGDKPFLVYFKGDILVTSDNVDLHLKVLEDLFLTLQSLNLVVDPNTSRFLQTQDVPFYGRSFSREGITPLPENVADLNSLSVPANKKQLSSLLTMFRFYASHIPSFNTTINPLLTLLAPRTPFLWDETAQQAFEDIRSKLHHSVTLALPRYADITPENPFIIRSDGSLSGISAILSSFARDREAPIAFYSAQLTDKQAKTLSATEVEMLAIVMAAKHFQPIIAGFPVQFVTDHAALVHALRTPSSNKRVDRYARFLS